MKRIATKPRSRWEKRVEELGLIYHHTGDGVYWNESVYYELSSSEVDTLEAATNSLQDLSIKAGQHVIDNNCFDQLGIPSAVVPLIKWAWNEEPPAIYGRMDLAYDGVNPPKLLEYNADTPTALLEASIVQWYWKEELFKPADQFNSIHERLVKKWRELKKYLVGTRLHFAHINDPQGEDTMTATYLRDTAEEAGITTAGIIVGDIGWNGRRFVDMSNRVMTDVFKLYPWEWLVHEQFAPNLLSTYREMNWIEPIWKMLFSNKGILPILWELNSGHPNLLPAYFDGPHDLSEYVRKPKLSREGWNIEYHSSAGNIATAGEYGEEGFIFQGIGPVFRADGNYSVVGSWVIDQESAGIGIRESTGPITNNLSTFVPHIFV
jgi:glutathionylspermidine synthase